MHRKWVWLFLSLGMMVLSALPVTAREPAGTLQVLPLWRGEPVAGGEITLYFVGTDTQEGIQVTDGLANWTFQEGDVLSEAWMQWVLDRVEMEPVTMTVHADIGAFFQDLSEGVYLIRQTKQPAGFGEMKPLLVRLPEGEQWDLVKMPELYIQAELPRTGDQPAPIIGAMGIGFCVAVLMVLADSRKK